jgi:hypothetical protein
MNSLSADDRSHGRKNEDDRNHAAAETSRRLPLIDDTTSQFFALRTGVHLSLFVAEGVNAWRPHSLAERKKTGRRRAAPFSMPVV